MKKEEEIIKTYRELIDFFTKLSNQNENEFLAEKSKEFVIDFAGKLAKYEKKDKSVYETMIDNVKGDKSKFVYDIDSKIEETEIDNKNPIDNKEDEYNNYIVNTIQNDKNLNEQLNRLTKKLIEDLKNPNDTLIEVWMKNYKDFVVKNNLNEDYMINYMKGVFQLYDINRDYVNDVEELYRQIDLDTPVLEDEKENTEIEKTNSEDNKKTTEDKKTNSEDDKKTTEDEKTNSEDDKKTTEDEKTNSEDDKKTPEDEKTNSEDEKIGKEIDTTAPIKIVSTKKALLNSGEKLGAGVAAIACLSTPFITPAILVAYMIYKLHKNYKYRNKNLQNFLKENGFDIDIKTGNLFRMEGDNKVIITEKELEKEEYSHVKKELMQMGAIKSGLIPEEYKKSKLLQVLMGLNPVKKLKDMKTKYIEMVKTVTAKDSYLGRKDKIEEIKSGMRRL